MNRLKQFDEATKRPRYDPKTVGRFVKNALFDPNKDGDGTNTTSSPSSTAKTVENWQEIGVKFIYFFIF